MCPGEAPERGLDPLAITGLLLRDLRDHFREGRIENTNLEDLIWIPRSDNPNAVDETRTKLFVEPWGFDLKQISGAPALIVKRLDWKGDRAVSIGGNAWQGGLTESDLPLAGTHYTNIIEGKHQIVCTSGSGGLTELLAWEVYRQLAHFACVWRSHYGFTECVVEGLSGQGNTEKLAEFEHAVAVIVRYSYTDTWVVAQVAPRLSGIAADLKGM
jgi:hypothetical protein